METIYLDNNATTRVAPEVFEEIKPYFCDLYGNPSSMHNFGGQVGSKINEARQRVASILGCDPSEIIFTSCGTESDNAAIYNALVTYPNKTKIITSAVEHPAVLSTCRNYKKHGYQIVELGVNRKGQIDLGQLADSIDNDTALVTLMHANNETGTIFPIEQAAKITREKGVLFHTDAVQSVGKISLNVKETDIDMLSISGHKLHAPKGIGVLYVRKGLKMHPFLAGGHQEKGRRAGTENVVGIIGIGKACQMAQANIDTENDYVRNLRDRLESGILANCPDCFINGDTENRLPNTTNISFEYIEGESILLLLDTLGICASSGSACTSGSLEPSHVLRAMDVPFTAAHGSIRFSFSVYNTQEQVDYVIEKIPPIIKRLRELSPFVPSSRS